MDEFCKSAPAHHLRNPNDGVYLVWKWNWSHSCDSLPSSSISISAKAESECDENGVESDVCDTESDIHDTVRFKVIGVTQDDEYQHALERVNELIQAKNDVKVALFQEPDNPVDANSCVYSMESGTNGYVVKEALDYVHTALSCNAIEDVKFAWVKFRIDFRRSGPAFYAAVDITRKGYWSPLVQNSASTK